MTQARPHFCDDVRINTDVLDVTRFHLVVRDQATGREHSFIFDDILIGSNEAGTAIEIVMPRWLADMEGIADA